MLNNTKINVSLGLLWGLIVLFAAAACTAATPEINLTATLASPGRLTPYASPSASAVPGSATPFATAAAIPTGTPWPSPTPFVYTIQAGDTYGGLALRYGSTISAIEAANPGIDPNLLIIGTTITIPLAGPEMTPTIIPTLAPVGVALDPPLCYPSADGGAWCLALAKNPLPVAVENLSGWLSLQTSHGEAHGATVYPPRNLLRPGEAIPLLHFFPPPLPQAYTPQVGLLTALPAAITTTRYITTNVQIGEVDIDSLQANVHGLVTFEPGSPPAGLLSVVAIAYDDAERPVGVAKWELAGDPLPARGVPFQVTVFSLGPAIARVDVTAEAIPAGAISTPTPESAAPE
ncbi:MAG: LysM peptidoglycan-binding domain-containing protein [Chloroflexota bacterium]